MTQSLLQCRASRRLMPSHATMKCKSTSHAISCYNAMQIDVSCHPCYNAMQVDVSCHPVLQCHASSVSSRRLRGGGNSPPPRKFQIPSKLSRHNVVFRCKWRSAPPKFEIPPPQSRGVWMKHCMQVDVSCHPCNNAMQVDVSCHPMLLCHASRRLMPSHATMPCKSTSHAILCYYAMQVDVSCHPMLQCHASRRLMPSHA